MKKLLSLTFLILMILAYAYYPSEVSAESNISLQSYSLSFESDPVRKWWPTAPNSVQQIDAAIWKDSDGNNVKNFTNLSAEWQVNPNYLEIINTSSSYFETCPVPTVSGRPCMRFVAHVITKMPGQSGIKLTVTDNQTGSQVWNAYPLEIYSLEESLITSVPESDISPLPVQQPTFIPDNQVNDQEFKEISQKVTYMQNQLDEQQKQLNETKGLLDRIVAFLRKIFQF